MISVGVIGYGYWGPNLVRNFQSSSEAHVKVVCDLNADRLEFMQKSYPGVQTTVDASELFSNPEVDAVAIATPVNSHYELALSALQAGKHIFVEKPFTETSDQSLRLIEEAEKRNLVIMVDHTFLYTGAVQKLAQLVNTGELGNIYYFDSERVNLGLFQPDVSVIWDLAVHDLAILDYVFPEKPVAVSATGVGHVPGRPANVAYMTLYFESQMIAHINVNWLAPVKLRRTLIGGDRKMVVYDDLEPSEKIKIYDKGIELKDKDSIYEMMIGYRTGDMYAPKLISTEALSLEVSQFVSAVEQGEKMVNDGRAGLRVVQVLEAASRSMSERGAPVELRL